MGRVVKRGLAKIMEIGGGHLCDSGDPGQGRLRVDYGGNHSLILYHQGIWKMKWSPTVAK